VQKYAPHIVTVAMIVAMRMSEFRVMLSHMSILGEAIGRSHRTIVHIGNGQLILEGCRRYMRM